MINSRYYNSEGNRFINCDAIIKAEENKYNLYIYCKKDPIGLRKSITNIGFNVGG